MEPEQEALEMGWTPKERFMGDPEKWVDAEAYLERGRALMPILRKNNEKLLGTIETLRGQVGTLQTSVTTATEAIEAYKTFQAESTAAQVAKARRDLLAELKSAKEENDADAEVEAVGKLSAFDAAQAAPKPAPAAPASAGVKPNGSAPAETTPEMKAWMKDNPWYGDDEVRTSLAMGLARQMRKDGITTTGREFLDSVKAGVEERLGTGEPRRASKVEGGGQGAPSRSGNGTDYASLPADAKAVCDKQAEKFVGPNKIFKTAKEWQNHYSEQYFKGN